VAAMRAAGQPEPLFEETTAGFKVTLRSALANFDVTAPEHAPVAGNGSLNERQRQAIIFVQSTGRITNSDLQAMAPEVSAETIRRDLADMVERNLLIRIGSKRATYYILK
jgi:ATP-dependent DNA helicase RecG